MAFNRLAVRARWVACLASLSLSAAAADAPAPTEGPSSDTVAGALVAEIDLTPQHLIESAKVEAMMESRLMGSFASSRPPITVRGEVSALKPPPEAASFVSDAENAMSSFLAAPMSTPASEPSTAGVLEGVIPHRPETGPATGRALVAQVSGRHESAATVEAEVGQMLLEQVGDSRDSRWLFGLLPFESPVALHRRFAALAEDWSELGFGTFSIESSPNFATHTARLLEQRYDFVYTAPHFAAHYIRSGIYVPLVVLETPLQVGWLVRTDAVDAVAQPADNRRIVAADRAPSAGGDASADAIAGRSVRQHDDGGAPVNDEADGLIDWLQAFCAAEIAGSPARPVDERAVGGEILLDRSPPLVEHEHSDNGNAATTWRIRIALPPSEAVIHVVGRTQVERALERLIPVCGGRPPEIVWIDMPSHNAAVSAVVSGRADVAGVSIFVVARALRESQPIRLVARSEAFPSAVILAHRRVPEAVRDAVQQRMTSLHEDPSAAAIREALGYPAWRDVADGEFERFYDLVPWLEFWDGTLQGRESAPVADHAPRIRGDRGVEETVFKESLQNKRAMPAAGIPDDQLSRPYVAFRNHVDGTVALAWMVGDRLREVL
ncbi:MAG: PhnD/SsuA/transferrin family substrate-binding protein [Thioalkalivibrionaceae bacterium]